MTDETLHPNVVFAAKFGDPTGDYLNAFTALARIEGLTEDAERMEQILTKVRDDTDIWSPWHGADIISYYAVGYVTCLEWHARSRIADLANFAPAALKSEDLKGQVSEKVMIQLLTQGASVANLISAATNVGSFTKYMGVFNRVLKALGATRDAHEYAQDVDPETSEPWLSTDDLQQLDSLFQYRNELVHEIGRGVIGHLNIRDSWAPSDAISSGKRVERLMKAMEAAITSLAPQHFPNLLDNNFWPIWRIERLKGEIIKLEEEVLSFIESQDWDGKERTKEEWHDALNASRLHQKTEYTFVEFAPFLHSRYIDLVSPLWDKLAQSRIDYLKMLLEHSKMLWGDVPVEDSDPSMQTI